MTQVIEVNNLVKKYNTLTAVNQISFQVEKGEIFGLLGENGAGKTTTLEIIEGLRKPTKGQIKVLGHDAIHRPQTIKNQIGVQLQASAYYNFLTLKEILELFASFYEKHLDPMELLEMVGLKKKANTFVGKLSGGQKQRFSIVASLINDPEIVFLDEPTTGLDPLARRNLWEIINKIKQRGKTIVLTTHYMEEAEVLCNRIAIMEKGKIVAIDTTQKLIENAKNPFEIDFEVDNLSEEALTKIEKLGILDKGIGNKSNTYELHLKNQSAVNQALAILHELNLKSLLVEKATLEDVFLELTGRTLNE
ncbi:MAG: ABC transporter ATP-binding protein [Patescibacteria group bacterium]|nr:ABC transporter ATP-binding protein [Patescibacteria group bacterium]